MSSASDAIGTVMYEHRSQLQGLLELDRPVRLLGFGANSSCRQWTLPYLARATGAQTHVVTITPLNSNISTHEKMTLAQFHHACLDRKADDSRLYVAGPNLLQQGADDSPSSVGGNPTGPCRPF